MEKPSSKDKIGLEQHIIVAISNSACYLPRTENKTCYWANDKNKLLLVNASHLPNATFIASSVFNIYILSILIILHKIDSTNPLQLYALTHALLLTHRHHLFTARSLFYERLGETKKVEQITRLSELF